MTTYLYVVLCADDTLYAGTTADIARRMQQHNGARPGGAKYTRSRRPVRLLLLWPYPNGTKAKRAEARFKRFARDKKDYYLKHGGVEGLWDNLGKATT